MKAAFLSLALTCLAAIAVAQAPGFDMARFKQLNEQCLTADGESAEGLGVQCVGMVLADPVYVVNYLDARRTLMESYAQHMGYEFYFKAEKLSNMSLDFEGFKTRIARNTANGAGCRDALKRLYGMIEEVMKQMD